MTISIDTSKFMENCRLTRKLFEQTQWEIVKMGDHFLDTIKHRTPKDTGETRDSWAIHMTRNIDVISWVISPDGRENIVTYLEWGVPRHVILPKEFPDGWLAFDTEEGEHVVCKIVIHPGQKPLGIVRQTQDEIDAHARALGAKLLERIGNLWGV